MIKYSKNQINNNLGHFPQKINSSSRISLLLLFAIIQFLIASIILASMPSIALAQQNNPKITHGIASGDVTNHSAIIWSKSNANSIMNVNYGPHPNFTNPISSNNSILVTNKTDYTGQIKLNNLKPNSQYYYQVWFSSPDNKSITSKPSAVGLFRTAADDSHQKDKISFVVGGDLGGQKYCERVGLGYPIFSVIRGLSPDFFVFNGDQIYADGDCAATGPDNLTGWPNIPGNYSAVTSKNVNWTDNNQVREIFNKHWEYNRADNHLQNLLSNTSLYSQADDHEVINNYGNWSYWNDVTKNRTGFKNVVNSGIQTFFDFSPIDKNKTNPHLIYRHFNWGKNMDLFILDAHSYRDRNDLSHNFTTANKTLFGKEQLQWLEQELLKSNATWKIVSDDDPMLIPVDCQNDGSHSPRGCDSWATDGNTTLNFANERNQFLKFLDDHNIKNVIFITTDVHFPANIVLKQDFNKDGHKLSLYELVSGPLSAVATKPGHLDPTVNATYLYNEGQIFNFGYYKIQKNPLDGKNHFIAEIRGIDGLTRPGSYLDLAPQ